MSPKTTLVILAMLLALAGCRENQIVDPNNSPVARAEVKGEDAVSPGEYEFDDTEVTLTLDGGDSEDRDGDLTDYVWISGTLDPGGSGGRYIPDGEDPDWPDDGEETEVTLEEGFWTFHLYVTDNEGSVSSPATVNIKVGDPPPLPMPGGDMAAGSGDGADATPEECVEVAGAIEGISDSCAECTCNNGGTCAADVAACDETCWGLINCVATECAGDGTDIPCITGACMAFLGAATQATAAGACAAECTAECSE